MNNPTFYVERINARYEVFCYNSDTNNCTTVKLAHSQNKSDAVRKAKEFYGGKKWANNADVKVVQM